MCHQSESPPGPLDQAPPAQLPARQSVTAPVLGDEYCTHYVENPDIPHQIDLIQIRPEAMTPRLWSEPAQGDLVIAIPVREPMAAYHAMPAADPLCRYSAPVEVPEENGIRFVPMVFAVQTSVGSQGTCKQSNHWGFCALN